MVTMICLGGYHSSVHPNEMDSIKLIQRAIDENNITFLDNGWDYHDGAARKTDRQGPRRGRSPRQASTHDQRSRSHAKDAESTSTTASAPSTDPSTSGSFTKSSTTTTPTGSSRRRARLTPAGAKEQRKIRYLGFTGHKTRRSTSKMLDKPFDGRYP